MKMVDFQPEFGPSESRLGMKSKISFFLRKLKIFEGKNNMTFLVFTKGYLYAED